MLVDDEPTRRELLEHRARLGHRVNHTPTCQRRARREGRLVGIGLASCVEICGFHDDETPDVGVDADGRVTVLTGSASHGQGHEPRGTLFPFGSHVAMVEVDWAAIQGAGVDGARQTRC